MNVLVCIIYLGTQFGDVFSTSQVANNFIGTGFDPVPSDFDVLSAITSSSSFRMRESFTCAFGSVRYFPYERGNIFITSKSTVILKVSENDNKSNYYYNIYSE